MQSKELKTFILFVIARFRRDRCTQIAASLTYTTLLSLVPFITIALTLFSAFPVFGSFSAQIKSFLLSYLMPATAGSVITHYTEQFAESAGRLGAAGVIFLAVTAMMMMLTMDRAFDTIWQVHRPRPIVRRLVVYWALLTLAPVLVGASLSLTSWLIGLSMGYAKHVPVFGVGILKGLPVLLTTMAFAMLFKLMPNRYVPVMHALIGGAVASVLFETMNRVFGLYISHFSTYKLVYGAFSSVPIFLVWIYLSWITILFGAVVAASLPHWRASRLPYLPPVMKMLDAMKVLYLMSNGMKLGNALTIPELSRKLRMDFYELEQIMERLALARMVSKAESHGWLMARDAAHIRAVELLNLFVLDKSALIAGKDPLQAWLLECVGKLEKSADVTLDELFSRMDGVV